MRSVARPPPFRTSGPGSRPRSPASRGPLPEITPQHAHPKEIVRCLLTVSLEPSEGLDVWLDVFAQLVPLEAHLSESTLARLRKVAESPAELQKLRAWDKDICEHFIKIPQLGARFRGLETLQRLQKFQDADRISRAIDLARDAYSVVLATEISDDVERGELRHEVRAFLKWMHRATKKRDLHELALVGRSYYADLWDEKSPSRKMFDPKVILDVFQTWLTPCSRLHGDAASARRVAELEPYLDLLNQLRKERDFLSQQAEGVWKGVADEVQRSVAEIVPHFERARKVGTAMLRALGCLRPALDVPAAGQDEKQLCQDLDQCAKDLMGILCQLESARGHAMAPPVASGTEARGRAHACQPRRRPLRSGLASGASSARRRAPRPLEAIASARILLRSCYVSAAAKTEAVADADVPMMGVSSSSAIPS